MYSIQTKSNFSLNIHGNIVILDRPYIMGILNLTPDSFYDGGQNSNHTIIIDKVAKMIDEGADIIDIGAMSSRPYSEEIPVSEELSRVRGILPLIKKAFPNTILSIDTYRTEIAEYAVNNGVSIINDITAGKKDEQILTIAKKYRTPYIAMHMLGMPQTMQNNLSYDNILSELMYFFSERLQLFAKIGLSDVILDVGFGFGKSIEDNFRLLKNLSYFNALNCPILAGISRKSMIYKPLNLSPKEALNGTTALHFEALRQGAHILRVHDVKEAKQVVDLFTIYKMANT